MNYRATEADKAAARSALNEFTEGKDVVILSEARKFVAARFPAFKWLDGMGMSYMLQAAGFNRDHDQRRSDPIQYRRAA
jgi:hypothetical protein